MSAGNDRLPGGAVPLGGGAVDLGKRGVTDEQVARARFDAEKKAGMRCYGCGRRIRVGFEFVRFAPAEQGTAMVMQTMRAFACTSEDCDFAEKAAKDCTAVRPIEWAYPDDPMPSGVVTESSPDDTVPCAGCGKTFTRAEVGEHPPGSWREVNGVFVGPCCPAE